MILNVIARDAATETYKDTEDLIRSVVWQIQRRFGGSFDNLMAEANLIFMKSFYSHNKHKASFTTWLYNRLWNGLIDIKRIEYKRVNCIWIENCPEPKVESKESFLDLLWDLSSDAKIVVTLVLDPPEKLQKDISYKHASNPKYFRGALRRHLHISLGWTMRRVQETFQEITEVLND